jgi:ribosomal protein L12E/L44/L45/RPP1/RPP2
MQNPIEETPPENPQESIKYGRGEHPNVRAVQYGSKDAPPRNQETKGATKPWSMRNVARYLAAQRIDTDDPVALKKLLGRWPTISEKIVAAAIIKASKGDMRSIEWLGNQIDGKVAETRINAEFADLEGKTDDELLRIATGIDIANEASSGPESDPEARGSEGAAEDESEPAGQTGNPESV